MLQKIKTLLLKTPIIQINLKVTPKSKNNQILECFEQLDGHLLLKIKIKGAPEKGKVNAELIDFLADQLHLPKSKLQIIAGLSSRNKILRINS